MSLQTNNLPKTYHYDALLCTYLTYIYDAFGQQTAGAGTAPCSFAFSTKYTDAETDLLYYGFRYYNSDTGRWLNRDPIGIEGGDNLYSINLNDMLNGFDLLGEKPCSGSGYTKFRDDRGGGREGRTTDQIIGPIEANGCGGRGGMPPPGALVSVHGVNFTLSCIKHDVYYGTCGVSRGKCDYAFLIAMRRQCFALKGFRRGLCRTRVQRFYNFVVSRGHTFFETGQDDYCAWECCEK